jgi:hypothetical protein
MENLKLFLELALKKIVLRVRQSTGKMEKCKTEGRKGRER